MEVVTHLEKPMDLVLMDPDPSPLKIPSILGQVMIFMTMMMDLVRMDLVPSLFNLDSIAVPLFTNSETTAETPLRRV